MKQNDRVPNEALVAAGLELMSQNGHPLSRVPTQGRAMIYRTPRGETVRVRTCNDHLLVVLADGTEVDARLNVEGTDYVLIVMPVTPRSYGPVMAFLVPTDVVAEAARSAHRQWLATSPRTKGNNRTWNLWFDGDATKAWGGFGHKWARYRLSGWAHTRPLMAPGDGAPAPGTDSALSKEVIASAKKRIAEAFGVPVEAVRISVDFT